MIAISRKMKQLFWLVISLAAANCFCIGCSPDVDARELLGSNKVTVSNDYYKDFGGVSTHGELFDFQECAVDTIGLHQLTQSTVFAHAPSDSLDRAFYKSKLKYVACNTWQQTPLDASANEVFHSVLLFGNLLDDEHSRQFLQKKYLTAPGNFYAYFAGWPVGVKLYVLVPTEGRLFIIRKRG